VLLQVLLKPESGLEPLTYRLQGDASIGLNASVLPAKSLVIGACENNGFRLI
jgi:hypothetical protein